jgi:acyl-CoA thioester hydrolase
MRHIYDCQLRWGDMDALNHVNNTRFLDYMQEARVDLFWTTPTRNGETPFAYDLVVARNEIDYLAPLVWREKHIQVEVWVISIKNSSFEVGYEIKDDSTVFARAKSVLVPFDVGTERPRRVTREDKVVLERYLDDQQG